MARSLALQQRPHTFARTNLSLHFSLATRRRTIHSGLPTVRTEHAQMRPCHQCANWCQLLSAAGSVFAPGMLSRLTGDRALLDAKNEFCLTLNHIQIA